MSILDWFKADPPSKHNRIELMSRIKPPRKTYFKKLEELLNDAEKYDNAGDKDVAKKMLVLLSEVALTEAKQVR